MKYDIYEVSYPILTHSIGFVVSELDRITYNNISILAKPVNDYVDYALKIANETWHMLEKLLKVKYPFEKLDIVTISDNKVKEDAIANMGLILAK